MSELEQLEEVLRTMFRYNLTDGYIGYEGNDPKLKLLFFDSCPSPAFDNLFITRKALIRYIKANPQ